jgi:hypothetical protein
MQTFLRSRLRLASLSVLLIAAAGCGKSTQLEAGAVMLDLSVASGVTTPDELRVSVYDGSGALWNDTRVPASGALVPESATHLGTVLIQPGAAQGALRVHARGLVASARVAVGVLTIPAGTRGTFALRLDADVPADDDGDGVPDAIDDCPAVANPSQTGCPATNDAAPDTAPDDGGANDTGGGGTDAFNCDASGACNRAIGAQCTDGAQCASSFCVDGVCCNNACDTPCRTCETGTCTNVTRKPDPPECEGTMTCNAAGKCYAL